MSYRGLAAMRRAPRLAALLLVIALAFCTASVRSYLSAFAGFPKALAAARHQPHAPRYASDWGDIDSEYDEDYQGQMEARPATQVGPGIYIAKTSIRLRSEADVDSELTGDLIKVGEVFEVAEVSSATDFEDLSYLKVGDRGWVFDLGIAGPWTGVPVVAPVMGAAAEAYARILRTPGKYAEYQAALGEEDFLQEEERPPPAASEGNDALWEDLQQEVEESELTEEEKQAFEVLCQDESERNLVLSSLRQAGGEAFRKLVIPRWMKLAQLLPPEMKREMEESKERYSTLPGSPSYKYRPNDAGRRMGMRVPSACTAM